MAAPTTDAAGDTTMNEPSPGRDDTAHTDQLRKAIATFDENHSDPDAQTTVTDFLDFTEYLPSDIIRSLTLIEKHDHTYTASSNQVNDLTKTWSQLPGLQAKDRPSPVQLRADISEQLNQAVSSRVFAHAEALRVSKNVDRHYNKAKLLLSKLQAMMENYPTEEQQAQSPTALRSPRLARARVAGRAAEDGESKTRPKRIPKIIVPGEVLAPYDIDYDTFTDGSDVSTDNDDDEVPVSVRKSVTTPRIKGGPAPGPKPPRPANRASRPASHTQPASAEAVAAQAAALLNPPPENAVVGSSDAPWLQLTEYELAKLRKRMKKNATWTPSDTMVLRELRALGRGPEDFKDAKKKAEEEGKPFEPEIPRPITENRSGHHNLPAGAISVESATADDLAMSKRGMKLSVAKKAKREELAKQAAEEAEESARKMAEAAKLLFVNSNPPSGAPSESPSDMGAKQAKTRANSRSNAKRKREAGLKADSEPPDGSESPSSFPGMKRTKTETPVPPPVHSAVVPASPLPGEPQSAPTPASAAHAETPVPLPVQSSSNSSTTGAVKPPTPTPTPHNIAFAVDNGEVSPTSLKPSASSADPAAGVSALETSVPLTRSERRKSATPVATALRELPSREVSRRETRGDAAKRTQQQHMQLTVDTAAVQTVTAEQNGRRSSSRGFTPGKSTPTAETAPTRRPASRGKSMGQEPQPSLAADRARRTSTARNTPAPEARPQVKRTKRPAPGIVSTTNSGGNSAVGKRKAAPRKKARTRKEKDQQAEVEMEDVDDEGNPIDPNEPRYCICNRVSFGTMIQCDNIENCKHEWFHLECVDLEDIPARTTKWYCPECRKVLNIGEKGEVSARGVRK